LSSIGRSSMAQKKQILVPERIKFKLLRIPLIEGINIWTRPANIRAFLMKRIKINRYLKNHRIIKLHLGCGKTRLKGWLNSDVHRGEIYLNVKKIFPFDNESIDFIFSEHLIEHLSLRDARYLLKECNRILKKGGVMRISTPDLEFYAKLYLGQFENITLDDFSQRIRPIYPKTPAPCVFMNEILTLFGHKFTYDREFLKYLCGQAGFTKMTDVEYGLSEYSELMMLEQHTSIKWVQNRATILLECSK